MTINKRGLVGIALVSIFLCQMTLEAAEQRGRRRGGGRGGAQQGQQSPQNPFFPTVGSQQELADYQAIEAEESPISKLTLSATFETTYPESQLKHLIKRVQLITYVSIGNHQAAISAAKSAFEAHSAFHASKMEETLESEARETPAFEQFQLDFANAKAYYLRSELESYDKLNNFKMVAEVGDAALEAETASFELYDSTADKSGPEYQRLTQQHEQLVVLNYSLMVSAYQMLGDIDNILSYAKKALVLDPDSLPFLMTVSDTMASRPAEDENEKKRQQSEAEEYAERALDLVERLLASPVSMQMSPDQKNGLTEAVRATLGRIYFNQEEWDDAIDEFEKAIEAKPNASNSYFFMGMSYVRKNDADDALDALAKAAFLKGPEEEQARSIIKNIWESLKKSGDVEEFIKEKGDSIGG